MVAMGGSRIYVPANSAEDWAAHLASPEKQWRAERSAFELAHAWQEAGGWPPAVERVITASSVPSLKEARPRLVMAEHETPLPGQGYASQSDALVLAEGPEGLVVITVEGKEREGFDALTEEWLDEGGENRLTRLRGVCQLLGLEPDAVQGIRWQLLHRTAAAVIEAQSLGARAAMMLVHSFSPTRESFEDYAALLELFGGEAQVDTVHQLTQLPSCQLLSAWVADCARPAVDAGRAEDVFLAALGWIETNYRRQRFFNERDLERSLQARMSWLISERRLPLRVFHGYPMKSADGRRRNVDLAILDENDHVALGVELKYEPARSRDGVDLWPGKIPVTEWKGVEADVDRIEEWAGAGRLEVGYAVFIDEGSAYRQRVCRGAWREWSKSRTGYETTVNVFRAAAKSADGDLTPAR